jgi:hypothetical protein
MLARHNWTRALVALAVAVYPSAAAGQANDPATEPPTDTEAADARARISWWDADTWSERDDRRSDWEREWRSYARRYPERVPTELALKLLGPDWVRRNQRRVVLRDGARDRRSVRTLLRELADEAARLERYDREWRRGGEFGGRTDLERRRPEVERRRAWYRDVFSRMRQMELEELERRAARSRPGRDPG